jgi:TonB family protein
MAGLAFQTTSLCGSAEYFDALSRLDGGSWGPVQLYVPNRSERSLYFKLFKGLASEQAAQFIDLSNPETSDFATIRHSLEACPDPDGLKYGLAGCKTEFFVGEAEIVAPGKIHCTATIKDTSKLRAPAREDRLVYTVEMTLVPQGNGSNEWKAISFKATLPAEVLPAPVSKIYNVGGDVVGPTLIHKVEPEHPSTVKVYGTVLLYVVVDSTGKTQQIRVRKSLEPSLDRNAVEAVKQWRFTPAKRNGEPVAIDAQIEVKYSHL